MTDDKAPVDEIMEILQFDPFEEGAGEKTPPDGTPPEGTPEDPGATPVVEPVVDPAVTPAVDPAVKPVDPAASAVPVVDPAATPVSPEPGTTAPISAPSELDVLKAQLLERDATISQLKVAPTVGPATSVAPAVTPAVAPGEAPAAEIPAYEFNIPPELSRMMQSEDPVEHGQGLSILLQGTAKAVHKQVMDAVRSQYTDQIPKMVQNMLNTTNQQRAVYDDFYGSNPDLNRTELYPLVQTIGQTVMAETGITTWSPTLRDLVAARVRAALSGAAPVVPATPSPAGVAPAPTTFMAGGTTRAPAQGNETLEQEVTTTLFG